MAPINKNPIDVSSHFSRTHQPDPGLVADLEASATAQAVVSSKKRAWSMTESNRQHVDFSTKFSTFIELQETCVTLW